MVSIIQRENKIEIGKKPIVILPLEEWEEIRELLEEQEDALRFNRTYNESRGEKMISLEELKKKYKL